MMKRSRCKAWTEPEEEEFEDAVVGVVDELSPEPVGQLMSVNMEQDQSEEQFDTDLPSLHSYLGAELEVVRGRTVLEDGAIVTLDMLQPADLVLVPGQTLPLTVFDPPTINMLRGCLRNDRTFGVLASWSDGRNTTINNIGTTAEIYEYLPDEGSAGFRVKAKARQRFRMLDPKSNQWKARVRILPEIKLPDPLQAVQLQSLNRHRTSPALHLKSRRADAAVTRWPAFVYEQYDVDKLIADIKKELSIFSQGQKDKEKEKAPVKVIIPDDPTELSFWVAQNVPMKEEHRLLLLRLNSPIQRLRWELRALQQCRQVLCCQYCLNMIGCSADMFSMSTEGPQSTYVNPGGYLHETITLYKVKNVFSIGPPSTEFSWFPGYGWSCCKCKHCNQHVGWKFTATKSQLKPVKFWGICRRSITVKMGTLQPADCDNQLLVF
ncbi:hypothetical protein J6590_009849 [Homalodisca vitripennis]|nr:hypothetical protein J6590_009849 [Homalodisca vitripennis]